MKLILIAVLSAIWTWICVLRCKRFRVCPICRTPLSGHALTCSARCRQIKCRSGLSQRRKQGVTVIKRYRHSLADERGGEPITITDRS